MLRRNACRLSFSAWKAASTRARRSVTKRRAVSPVAGHAVVEDEVGEVGEAEQGGLFVAEAEDLGEQVAVVVGAGGGADVGGAVQLLAQVGALGVGHEGEEAGLLEGEAEAREAAGLGAGARGVDGGGREAGEVGGVGEDELEGVGGVEDVLAELGGAWARATPISARRCLPAGGSSAPWRRKSSRVLWRKRCRAPVRALRVIGVGVGAQGLPQAVVERELGVELGDGGLHGVVGGAQLGGGGDGLEVADDGHGEVEGLGGGVEGERGCWRSCAGRLGDDALDGLRGPRRAVVSTAGSTCSGRMRSKGTCRGIWRRGLSCTGRR
jgi:hypothetical protein